MVATESVDVERNRLEQLLHVSKYVVVANLILLGLFLVAPQQYEQWRTGHQEESWGLQLGLLLFGAPGLICLAIQICCWLVATDRMAKKFRQQLGMFVLTTVIWTIGYFWLLSG